MGRIVTLIATVACTLTAACSIGVVRLQRAVESGPPRSARIAVIELAANAVDAPGPLDVELARLEAAALGLELRLERVTAPDLQALLDAGFDAWVLPGQERISDADVAALDAFALSGGGLLLTGASGRLDAAGAPRDPLPLQGMFPGHRFAPLPARERVLRAGPRSVVLAGLEPGARLRASGGGLRTLTSGSLVDDGDPELGLALAGRHRSAPVAWLGVPADALGSGGDALLASTLRWIAGYPVVELRPWPRGHRSAAVVTLELGAEGDAVEAAARQLARRGLAPVVAVAPARAESDPRLLRRLAGLGEIALAYEPETGLPAEGRARLERAARRPVEGLVGPASPDRAEHLRGSGYRWAALEDGEARAPRMAGEADGGLVALPRASRSVTDAVDPVTLLARLLATQAEVASVDGLFHAALTSRGLAADGGSLVDALLAELGSRDVWLAGGGEVAAWWRARAGIRGELAPLGPRQARLSLRNEGVSRADGVAARVYLPARSRPPRLRARSWWRPSARWRVARDRSWIELLAPALDPGDAVEYILTF